MDMLTFERLHETPGFGVIIGVAASAHRTAQPKVSQGLTIKIGGILGRFKRSSQHNVPAHRRYGFKASAGVFHRRALRGLELRVIATAARSSALCALRSVPFGKYWRSRPLVFSLVPRCQGLRGSQK